MPAKFIVIRLKPGHADRIVSTNNDYHKNESQCEKLNALDNGSMYASGRWEDGEELGLAY